MKASKLYNFREMNSYQFIAVVGLIMTFAAHIILLLTDKHIASYNALYVCWVGVFIVGAIINYNTKPDDHHGHHHHH
ncbi:hypothetical protein [Adhaeribacter radiodurans]|uniref:Uncharacterized protein n=1 Tax=Adhaeribacter radiodurans TaxID=2745197 RepID=A0A7L7L7U0_9BACT|nr:hypothetical protein [Adhaeribacter radiodurans]QMU28814.1 hypothetical protein HUW48_12550 [Adhaeribacter radiodurans]